MNHAYYLMVMGGTNRVSGISVKGIGFDQMERMERIFYRGFVYYLVPSSNFSDAREATIRASPGTLRGWRRRRTDRPCRLECGRCPMIKTRKSCLAATIVLTLLPALVLAQEEGTTEEKKKKRRPAPHPYELPAGTPEL